MLNRNEKRTLNLIKRSLPNVIVNPWSIDSIAGGLNGQTNLDVTMPLYNIMEGYTCQKTRQRVRVVNRFRQFEIEEQIVK